jgi:GNAT superfamily N-acetyltransferase
VGKVSGADQVSHTPVEQISVPEKLTAAHDLSQFQCGEPELDDWLRRRALSNEEHGASRTYVVCAGLRVVGYYALAAGAVAHRDAPGRVKRNMPNPVPVMVIGRLAIDLSFQGRGIGSALLRDAVLRTAQAAKIAGIRAILVHAISDSAKRFYERCGFIPSPVDPMTLMITVAQAVHTLQLPSSECCLPQPAGQR